MQPLIVTLILGVTSSLIAAYIYEKSKGFARHGETGFYAIGGAIFDICHAILLLAMATVIGLPIVLRNLIIELPIIVWDISTDFIDIISSGLTRASIRPRRKLRRWFRSDSIRSGRQNLKELFDRDRCSQMSVIVARLRHVRRVAGFYSRMVVEQVRHVVARRRT